MVSAAVNITALVSGSRKHSFMTDTERSEVQVVRADLIPEQTHGAFYHGSGQLSCLGASATSFGPGAGPDQLCFVTEAWTKSWWLSRASRCLAGFQERNGVERSCGQRLFSFSLAAAERSDVE